MKNYLTNWQTSLAGVSLLLYAILSSTFSFKVPGFTMSPGEAFVIGLGLLQAKDGNVTGGAVAATSEAVNRVAMIGLAIGGFLLLNTSGANAADIARKALASEPVIAGYSGNGFYKGVGTFMEMNDAQTALGNVNAAGGALNAVVGYQWANPTRNSFTALQGSCAYHNVGGSNIVGAVSSRWSCEGLLKFGGSITNVLQWLPSGISFPTLPAVGSAVGSAHPWIGAGARLQDAKADVSGASKHNISGKAFLGAGLLQQYCTDAVTCGTMDTFFEFNPSQDGFSVLGQNQKLGKGYRAGINWLF